MRKLSYRHKVRLKKIAKISLIALAALILVVSFYLIYLQRHVVYHRDGVALDFEQHTDTIPISDGSDAAQNTPVLPQVEIDYVDDGSRVGALTQVTGYYISANMLVNHTEAVADALQQLTEPCWIMIDLKNPSGNFYYSTQITGADTAATDTEAVDEILRDLKTRGFKLIARIPAFADSAFALEHQETALQMSSGVLWTDSDGIYWLDPANSLVQDYLQQICKELSSLGFSEVVFEDFYFPTSGNISYDSTLTKSEIIDGVANDMKNAFAASNLTISFCTDEATFALSSVSGRLYFTNSSGANLETIANAASNIVVDPVSQVVFLTDSHDTRYDTYSLLRPLVDTEKLESEAAAAPAPEESDEESPAEAPPVTEEPAATE